MPLRRDLHALTGDQMGQAVEPNELVASILEAAMLLLGGHRFIAVWTLFERGINADLTLFQAVIVPRFTNTTRKRMILPSHFGEFTPTWSKRESSARVCGRTARPGSWFASFSLLLMRGSGWTPREILGRSLRWWPIAAVTRGSTPFYTPFHTLIHAVSHAFCQLEV